MLELTKKNYLDFKARVDQFFFMNNFSGNLSKAVDLFEKAIPLANTELEMGHLFGLRDAAIAQTTVSTRLGMVLPGMG